MGKELPSQRLVKIKLGKVLLLKQITQQGFNLKELCEKKKQFHGENKQFREENKQLNVQLVEVNMNVNVRLDPYVTVSTGLGRGQRGTIVDMPQRTRLPLQTPFAADHGLALIVPPLLSLINSHFEGLEHAGNMGQDIVLHRILEPVT